MRWVRAITMAVVGVTCVALACGSAVRASGAPRSADSGSLTVYTSPDPSTVASVAYIYSPDALATAPHVAVTGPGTDWTGTAVFQKAASPGQWWDARLPGGPAGIYRATVTAADGGVAVSGASSYQIVATSGIGPRWTSVGPAVAGGQFAIDPGDPRSLYIASALAGELFASHTSGVAWQEERTLPVAGGYPVALLVTGGFAHRLIMGINGGNGQYIDDPTYTGKILESDDGGGHWRDLNMPDAYVNTVLATPDGRALVAVTASGIYVTSDDGGSWQHVAIPWNGQQYSAATLAGGDLYVATLSGLYVMRDVASGHPGAATLVFAPQQSAWVQAVAGNGSTIYADAFRGGLYASADGGRTWTHVYDPPATVSMLDDVNGRLYLSGQDAILVSGDGGTSWTSWPEPVDGLLVTSVAAAGQNVYVSTLDGGVFVTANQGGSYLWLGGISDRDAYGIAVAATAHGGEIVAGTDSGTFRASAPAADTGGRYAWGGPSPLPVFNVTTPLAATTPDHATVYKVVDGPRIGTFTVYASADAGATWRTLGPVNYGAPGALLVDPAEPAGLYVAGSSGITGNTLTISRNAGATWTSVTLPGQITAMAGDPADPRRLWLGGPAGLWTSANGGKTFTKLQSVPVTALDALGGGRLILGGSRFYLSTDSGKTLSPASQPDLDLSVTALLTVGKTVYAGTGAFHEAGLLKGGHGVLRSSDGGASWQLVSDAGLSDLDVLSLASSPSGDQLYAGTLRGGVYVLPISQHA
jgi:minor extracellular serine protease Vpr